MRHVAQRIPRPGTIQFYFLLRLSQVFKVPLVASLLLAVRPGAPSSFLSITFCRVSSFSFSCFSSVIAQPTERSQTFIPQGIWCQVAPPGSSLGEIVHKSQVARSVTGFLLFFSLSLSAFLSGLIRGWGVGLHYLITTICSKNCKHRERII